MGRTFWKRRDEVSDHHDSSDTLQTQLPDVGCCIGYGRSAAEVSGLFGAFVGAFAIG